MKTNESLVDGLDRWQKAILVVLGGLQELLDKGLVEGPPAPLTKHGAEMAKQLERDGFIPTAGESSAVLRFLMSGGLDDDTEEPAT